MSVNLEIAIGQVTSVHHTSRPACSKVNANGACTFTLMIKGGILVIFWRSMTH